MWFSCKIDFQLEIIVNIIIHDFIIKHIKFISKKILRERVELSSVKGICCGFLEP